MISEMANIAAECVKNPRKASILVPKSWDATFVRIREKGSAFGGDTAHAGPFKRLGAIFAY